MYISTTIVLRNDVSRRCCKKLSEEMSILAAEVTTMHVLQQR